jgi:predicted phosphodiesterase
MKLAVLSDIHSNLAALEAVLKDAHERAAEKFLCLGDILGSGLKQEECVQRIQSFDAPTVIGNRDMYAVDLFAQFPMAASSMNDPGFKHAGLPLTNSSIRWLRDLPYTVRLWGVSGVHSSFHCPEKWTYLDCPDAARASIQRQPTAIAFFGHTHEQGFWPEDAGRFIAPTPNCLQRLDPNRRYAINPGSVGKPRTPSDKPDPRAQYLIFDGDTLSVTFIRVACRL